MSRYGAPLPAAFYDREPDRVARELLGAVLRMEDGPEVVSGRIVETGGWIDIHLIADE